MKWESLNLGPKFPYLGIFRLACDKEDIVTFEASSYFSKVLFKIKNP